MDMQIIDTLIAEGKYVAALSYIDSSLAEQPNDVNVLMAKAKVLIANKQEKEAIPVLEKVIAIDSNHALSMRLLSKLYTSANDAANSTKYSNKVIELEKKQIFSPTNHESPAKNNDAPPKSRVIIKQSGSGDNIVKTEILDEKQQDTIAGYLASLVKVPNLEGAMLTDLDGLPIKYHFKNNNDIDSDSMAAVTQAIIKASRDILKNIGMADVASVTVAMSEQVILISSIENIVLSVFVNPSANQGLVKLETKRILDKITAALNQS
jgi:predicted regulator of Ras-like GTPase activity (Roadblock/LC7/MglB family)